MNSIPQSWLGLVRRRTALFVIILFAVLLAFPAPADAISASNLITLTNKERTSHGIAPLNYNAKLASSAYAKAKDMLAKGYWAHNAPDGTTPWTFIKNAGYSYVTVGENLARDFSSDSAAVAGWMASPGHRANILNSAYRDVGIAAVQGAMNGQSVSLVVAHYGATSMAPVPKPSYQSKKTPRSTTKQAVPQPNTTTKRPQVASEKVSRSTKPAPAKKAPVSQPKPSAKKTVSALQRLINQLVRWLDISPVTSVRVQ